MNPAPPTFSRARAFTCVALMWAAIYLPGLGSLEIKGEEGRRLLPAVTMLETGNWIVPQIGGVDYLAKPPLINWLAAGAFKLAGDPRNEWAPRAPSALVVLALGLCIVGALTRWLGASGALLAAVFALTNIGLMEKGRLAEIEALYLGLTGIAVVLWLGSWRRDVAERGGKPSWRTWTLPWVFLGLGMLTKGPLHLLFFYAVVGAVLVCAGRKRDWLNAPHLVGVVLMLAIFTAWAVPYLRQTAAHGAGGVWWEQFRGRVEVNEKFHLATWALNIPRGLANYLPWTVLLPLAFRRVPAASDEAPDAALDRGIARGLRWAVAGCFLAVSLAPGGQPRYTLPLLTPASVLLALVLVREWRLPAWLPVVWAGTINFCLALALLGALAALTQDMAGWWCWLVAVTIPGWWAWGRIAHAQKGMEDWQVFALISAVVMGSFTADYAVGIVPILRRNETVRPPAEEVNRAAGGQPVTVLRPGFVPFLFYLRPGLQYAQTFADVPPAARYVLLRAEDADAGAAVWSTENRAWTLLLRVTDKRTHTEWRLVRLDPASKEGL